MLKTDGVKQLKDTSILKFIVKEAILSYKLTNYEIWVIDSYLEKIYDRYYDSIMSTEYIDWAKSFINLSIYLKKTNDLDLLTTIFVKEVLNFKIVNSENFFQFYKICARLVIDDDYSINLLKLEKLYFEYLYTYKTKELNVDKIKHLTKYYDNNYKFHVLGNFLEVLKDVDTFEHIGNKKEIFAELFIHSPIAASYILSNDVGFSDIDNYIIDKYILGKNMEDQISSVNNFTNRFHDASKIYSIPPTIMNSPSFDLEVSLVGYTVFFKTYNRFLNKIDSTYLLRSYLSLLLDSYKDIIRNKNIFKNIGLLTLFESVFSYAFYNIGTTELDKIDLEEEIKKSIYTHINYIKSLIQLFETINKSIKQSNLPQSIKDDLYNSIQLKNSFPKDIDGSMNKALYIKKAVNNMRWRLLKEVPSNMLNLSFKAIDEAELYYILIKKNLSEAEALAIYRLSIIVPSVIGRNKKGEYNLYLTKDELNILV